MPPTSYGNSSESRGLLSSGTARSVTSLPAGLPEEGKVMEYLIFLSGVAVGVCVAMLCVGLAIRSDKGVLGGRL